MPSSEELAELRRQVRLVDELAVHVRERLYAQQTDRWRAVTAVAAAVAEETYRRADALLQWCNETSELWRTHLASVWRYLDGEETQFYVLSRAIADFLVSPLNHNEGQDGPDDFDRPQTIAAYCAALAALDDAVDHAELAVRQLFEVIELAYDGQLTPVRRADVADAEAYVRRVVTEVFRG